MYSFLLPLHSTIRWFVFASLLYTIFRAYNGYFHHLPFTKLDNAFRHWTATIAHIQLTVGVILYIKSPVVQYYWRADGDNSDPSDIMFFALVHLLMMSLAVIVLTIGSAKAKRNTTDSQRFKTILLWFSAALTIIFIAIPWPFSPLASRPLFRSF